MTDIPNTEYITINKDGVFVGGKPATKYRNEEIYGIDLVQSYFVGVLKLNPHVTELHVLSSETRGKRTVAGNPSGKHGLNEWCRVKYKNGNLGAWVFSNAHCSAAYCANYCAYYCAYHVRYYASFRSVVFGAIDKEKTTQKPINPVVVATNNEAQIKR